MVYRIFAEKKPPFAQEAQGLLRELTGFLGVTGLEQVRILNRYDAENITQALFEAAIPTVFSEPQVDVACQTPALNGAAAVFAVEFLPGQFDQRADSAAQCIQLMAQCDRPLIRSAKVYALYGSVSREELAGPEGSRSNLADVYIGYLRRKLRPLFGDGAILAVRGKGYLLKLP